MKLHPQNPTPGAIGGHQHIITGQPCIPHDHHVVGTCSKCRGPVTVPTYLSGAFALPRCASCGATKKATYGPIIEME